MSLLNALRHLSGGAPKKDCSDPSETRSSSPLPARPKLVFGRAVVGFVDFDHKSNVSGIAELHIVLPIKTGHTVPAGLRARCFVGELPVLAYVAVSEDTVKLLVPLPDDVDLRSPTSVELIWIGGSGDMRPVKLVIQIEQKKE